MVCFTWSCARLSLMHFAAPSMNPCASSVSAKKINPPSPLISPPSKLAMASSPFAKRKSTCSGCTCDVDFAKFDSSLFSDVDFDNQHSEPSVESTQSLKTGSKIRSATAALYFAHCFFLRGVLKRWKPLLENR